MKCQEKLAHKQPSNDRLLTVFLHQKAHYYNENDDSAFTSVVVGSNPDDGNMENANSLYRYNQLFKRI